MTRPVFDPEKKRGSLAARWGVSYSELTAIMQRMRDMEGMSLKAIARQLGCAHTTVRYHLVRPIIEAVSDAQIPGQESLL